MGDGSLEQSPRMFGPRWREAMMGGTQRRAGKKTMAEEGGGAHVMSTTGI